MTSVAQQYTSEIKRALHYNAIWLPSDKLELGVIGEVQDGIFVPQDHIRQVLGIHLHADASPSQSNNSLTYQSQAGVTLEAKASGATSGAFQYIGKAQAGISVTFGSQGACVFSVPRYRVRRAANQIALKRELLKRIDNSWSLNYAVVSAVILAESATILVAQDSQARVEWQLRI